MLVALLNPASVGGIILTVLGIEGKQTLSLIVGIALILAGVLVR